MKLHQQGNEIIVTELRPMSDAKQDELALYLHKESGFFTGVKAEDLVIDEYGSLIDISTLLGWLPVPKYRPELKQTKENDIDYYHGA